MVSNTLLFAAISVALASQVSAHASIWHPSMWGYHRNAEKPFHRPQDPLMNLTFNEWWMHNHLGDPPPADAIFEFRAGESAMMEIACDQGATSYYKDNPNGDIRDLKNPDWPCPRKPSKEFHANNKADVSGCALAVVHEWDITKVVPEDLTVFSTNHTCVWYLHTYFEVPKNMPPCPKRPDGTEQCICTFNWIHAANSGAEQTYLNGFQCNFTNTISTVPVGKPQVARRCGPDPIAGSQATSKNCTDGPKQPLYWMQDERNNVVAPYYDPPQYNLKYNFADGAQNDIFVGAGTTNSRPPTVQNVHPNSVLTTPASSPTPTGTNEEHYPSQTGSGDGQHPSHTGSSHHHRPSEHGHHKESSCGAGHSQHSHPKATPSSGPYARDENDTEESLRRAWGQHRRSADKRRTF